MAADRLRVLVNATVLACAALMGSVLSAQRGASPTGEWRAFGGDLGSTKYSPLDQINKENFARLRPVWHWRSADAFLSRTVSGGGEVWTDSRHIFEQLKKEDPKRWPRP
jgi:glucose dehydrogenase